MSDSSRLRRRLLTLSSALLGLPTLASAQTWTGAGADASMATAANWSPVAVPGSTAALTFPNLTNANQRYNVSFSTGSPFSSMTFTSTNAYTFSSASTLTLGNTTPNINSLNVTGSGGVTFGNLTTYNTNTTFAATGSNIAFAGPFTAATGLSLTLNAATNRTISFTGGLTLTSNSVVSSVGSGTVIFNPSSATTFASSSVRSLAGTMLIQSGGASALTAAGGTVRVSGSASLFGDISISNNSLVDLLTSQFVSSLSMTRGRLQTTAGTTITFTSGIAIPADSGATPVLAANIASTSFNVPLGTRSSFIDLDIAGNLVAATSTYTSTPVSSAGGALRFEPGSAGSTTLLARVEDNMRWTLNGGRPVAPGGLIEVNSAALVLDSPNTGRILDATVRVKNGSNLQITGILVQLSNLITDAGSNTSFLALMVIPTVQNSGTTSVFSNSQFTTFNNFGILDVDSPSAVTFTSLTNAATGLMSFGGTGGVVGSIDNAGLLQVGTASTHLTGLYIHRPGATLELLNNRFTLFSTSTANGFKFFGNFTLGANQLLEALGQAGFTNTATFTLAGGTIAVQNTDANAPHVNLGTLTGAGTLDAIANSTLTFFFNDGLLKPVGTINTTGPLALVNRLGTVEITAGSKLGMQPAFGTFTNRALVTLAGGTLGDTNTSFLNDAAGLTSGFGRITSNVTNNGVLRVVGGQLFAIDGTLSNAGTLRVDDGLLQLNSIFNPTNTGILNIASAGVLTGQATLINTGRIQGSGQINMEILNNPGGRIEPQGTLILGRELISAGSSQINLKAGSELVLQQGFSGDAVSGLLALTGGALDTNGQTVTNASNGSITGWGSLTTGGLRNSGNMTFSGGTSLINGPVANDAGRNLRVQSAVAIFTGPVTNNGSLIVTNGDAIFTGGFSGGAPLGAPLAATPNALAGTGNTTLNPNTFLESDGLTQNTLTVGAGARVLVSTREPDAVAVDGRSAPASTSVLETISIAKDVGTGKYTGFVDLTTNDLVVRSPNRAGQVAEIANLRDMVRGWYTGQSGLPSQTGLGTTSAFYNPLDAFVTLSVFDNDPNGDGVGELATFNGLSILATDVIVKYTYLGDTDLDGQVTATDLARVLMGLNGQGVGWNFGDVDHDGVVTNFDLGRTMAALRGQGAPLGFVAGGGGGAIPEPGSIGLIAAAGLGLVRRRR